MKLNKNAIKYVINYVIDNQVFDLDEGCMNSIELLTIVNDLSGDTDNKRKEISTAIYRCIQEGLLNSNYPNIMWGRAVIYDVTFRGFLWLENN
ncbi:hypothetical protein C823_007651 [Eubacterium plexicaudatum ASF492]|uniref:Uncharacterized protein n=1 Tax=Eubacterium plexicaudatum ASF492 TaxID=1235802 RepID=N2AAI3_9FIRM|nr:hypothetical protein C823_007651 [Eubacterium plexicaudatum ASF492]